jgi:hypothetical protein
MATQRVATLAEQFEVATQQERRAVMQAALPVAMPAVLPAVEQ